MPVPCEEVVANAGRLPVVDVEAEALQLRQDRR